MPVGLDVDVHVDPRSAIGQHGGTRQRILTDTVCARSGEPTGQRRWLHCRRAHLCADPIADMPGIAGTVSDVDPLRPGQAGDLLWTPSPERVANANITAFIRWLKETRLDFAGYPELWDWSVTDTDAFWQAIWDYNDIVAAAPPAAVLGKQEMPGAEWFPGARLNYAQNVMRRESRRGRALLPLGDHAGHPAVLGRAREQRPRARHPLRNLGVQPGDRVASTLPNIPEAVIAMLATTSIGAIWTSVSPDFGWRGVLDRFRQLQPRVLICTGGYQYDGKDYDRCGELRQIIDELTCLEHVIYLPGRAGRPLAQDWHDLLDHPPVPRDGLHVPPRAVRDAAVDLVLQRHHRTAESDHPQPRRHPPRAAEAAAAEHGPPGRRAVLLHHDRLDDVELHGQLAGARREAAAVRRQPRLPGAGRAVADGRRREGDDVRRVARVRGHARQGGRGAEGQVRPGRPSA